MSVKESTGGRSSGLSGTDCGGAAEWRASERATLRKAAVTLLALGEELRELAEAMAGDAGALHYDGAELGMPETVCTRQGLRSGEPAAVTCGACARFLEASGERRQHGEPALSFEIRRAAARIARAAGPDVEVTVFGFADEDPKATAAELGYRAIREKVTH